jgi:hypothetical protein
MRVEITTKVDKIISEKLGNKTILNNSLIGKSVASISPQGQEMLIDQADSKEWILNATSGPAFNLDILPLINSVIGKVKLVHIECYKEILKPGDIHAPIRFSLNWGGTAMGKMSQFQLANADSLTAASITISNIEVSGTDNAILQLVFCTKQ